MGDSGIVGKKVGDSGIVGKKREREWGRKGRESGGEKGESGG